MRLYLKYYLNKRITKISYQKLSHQKVFYFKKIYEINFYFNFWKNLKKSFS